MGIPKLKIRRSWDRLIFNMGIPILVRHLYIDKAQGLCLNTKTVYTNMHKSHHKGKMVMRPTYLYTYNENSYTGKTTFLYWNRSQRFIWKMIQSSSKEKYVPPNMYMISLCFILCCDYNKSSWWSLFTYILQDDFIGPKIALVHTSEVNLQNVYFKTAQTQPRI